MTSGFKDLLASERGVFCILALLVSSALVVVGKLSADSWISFMQYLTGVLVASKTVTTAVETYATKQPQIPKAQVVKDNATGDATPKE